MKSAEQKAKKVPTIRFAGFDDEWVENTLGSLMEVTSVKRIHQSDWTDSGVRFLRARDIVAKAKNEIITEPLFISQEKYEEYSLLSGKVHPGDMLVTGVGTIGVPMMIDDDKPLYFKDGNIIWFKNEHIIDDRFLYHAFNSESIQSFIKESAGIGTVGTYTIDCGKKTPISLPLQRNEQQKIGSFFSNIDSLISLEQKKYDKLTQVKKAMLEKMFPKEGMTVPEIRFANFTGEWEKKKLGNIGIVIDPHPSHRAPKEEPGGIPFIGIGDVDAMGVINRKTARPVSPLVYEDHHKRYDLSLPSLGLARVASLGKVIRLRADVGKYAVSPTMSVIQFNKTVDVDYVYSFMSTPIFQKQFEGKSNGSTRQSVGTEMVRILDVNIPPNINEQQKIGSYFSHLDSLISLQQRKLDKLKNIKKSLLEKMFV